MSEYLIADAKSTNVVLHMCRIMLSKNVEESFVCVNAKKQSAVWHMPSIGVKLPLDIAGFVHEIHDLIMKKSVEPVKSELFSEGLSIKKWSVVLDSASFGGSFMHVQSFEREKKTWFHFKKVNAFKSFSEEKSALDKKLLTLGL